MRVEDSPTPTARADEALIRVLWTGLCGSDLEEYQHGPVVARPGVVLGHEIVGRVEVPAADGSGPGVGTAVAVDVVTGCGQCYGCQRHVEGLCPELVVTGQHVDGGLAEYVLARAHRLVPIPEGIDVRHATLAEPAAVAVHAIRQLGPLIGANAVVVGGGTVGLLVTQLLTHAGASPVVILEPTDWRREIAGTLNLRAAWAPDEDSRRTLLAQAFPERGVDLVVECAGAPHAANESIHLARPGGTVLLLGVPVDDGLIDLRNIVLGEKQVRGSAAHMWDDDLQTAVGYLASGVFKVGPMITHEVPLSEVPDAFEQLGDGTKRVLKMIVNCGPGSMSPRR